MQKKEKSLAASFPCSTPPRKTERAQQMPSGNTMDSPSSTDERSPLLHNGQRTTSSSHTHTPIIEVQAGGHQQQPATASHHQGQQDDQASSLESEQAPWTRPALLTASLCTSFLILFAIADLLRWVSTTRLLELGICREYYLSHPSPSIHVIGLSTVAPGTLSLEDCTLPPIQSRLATLRGTLSSLEAFLSLVFTLPYGLLIIPRLVRLGRHGQGHGLGGGERLLAGINVVGYLLSCAWLMLVCSYNPSIFTINATIWAPVVRVLVGGGAPLLSSLVYAIAAGAVPKQKRASVFMVFVGAQLGAGVVGLWSAAAMLDRGWEMGAMGMNFPLGVGCLVVLGCMPAAAPGGKKGEEESESTCGGSGEGGDSDGVDGGEGDDSKHVTASSSLSVSSLLFSVKHSTAVMSQLLTNDRRVLVLLATIPIAKCINPVEELMVQYIPRRFDISLASASRSLTISTFESLLLLLFILPFFKSAAQTRFQLSSTKVDLYIVQCGFLLQGLGCAIMAISPTLVVFILGLMVLALGCSTRAALQSLLTDLVGKTEHITALYTVIAVGDGIGSAAGALLLNRALAIGISWDEKKYIGLPFVVAAALFCVAFGGTASVPVRVRRKRRMSNVSSVSQEV